MIQTGITINKIGYFLKEHLSVLIIVPAFIGGLWQSIELMSISTPYIRFFSISQIVPDGILILMFLVIAFSYHTIGWFADVLFFVKGEPKPTEYLSSEDYEKYRKKKLIYWTIFFFVSYVFSVLYLLYIKDDKLKSTQLNGLVVMSYLMVFILNRSLSNCYYYAKDIHKELFKGWLLFILYFILVLYFGKHIHNSFIAPSNIVNVEQVKSDVAQKYPNTKQELLYFNDKYIFVKIIDKFKKDKKGKIIKHTNEKIYIMKLESLFNK